MLALPLVTMNTPLWATVIWFTLCWAHMLLGALMLLEINLLYPQDSNLVSMAGHTLDVWGRGAAWVLYLFLLYTLLSAYLSVLTDVAYHALQNIGEHNPYWETLGLAVIFSMVVYHGIGLVDNFNRLLILSKLLLLLLLVLALCPFVSLNQWSEGSFYHVAGDGMVVITSFGFAIVIPSIRSYLQSDVIQIKRAVVWGSLCPLIAYLLWCGVIKGVLSQPLGREGSVSALIAELSQHVELVWLEAVAVIFMVLCVVTSLLGVALSLADFLRDGFKAGGMTSLKPGSVAALVFVPPLLINLLYPNLFIMGLSFAGYGCVMILIWLPLAMVWRSRYQQKISRDYQLWGGKPLLGLQALFSIVVFICHGWS